MAKKQHRVTVRLPKPAELRAWAVKNGWQGIGEKGRIPFEVELDYIETKREERRQDYVARAQKRLATQGRKPRHA